MSQQNEIYIIIEGSGPTTVSTRTVYATWDMDKAERLRGELALAHPAYHYIIEAVEVV